MALKIRMSRAGAKKRPFYRIVVADQRYSRDGRFIERLGTYNPLLPKDHSERLKFDIERAKYWLGVGAQPSDRIARFLDEAGVRERVPHNNPEKAKPKAKAQERMAALKEKAEAKEQAEAEAKEQAEAAPETPAEEVAETPAEEVAPEISAEAPAEEATAEAPAEEATAETPAEEAPAETPAEEAAPAETAPAPEAETDEAKKE